MSATEQQLHAPAAAAATEPSPELPADKQMIYAIVNEFLGTDTFNNPEAEASLLDLNTRGQSASGYAAAEKGKRKTVNGQWSMANGSC